MKKKLDKVHILRSFSIKVVAQWVMWIMCNFSCQMFSNYNKRFFYNNMENECSDNSNDKVTGESMKLKLVLN